MTVVCERHIPRAFVGKFLDSRNVRPDRISIFDADHRNLFARFRNSFDIFRGQCEFDLIGRDLLRQTVNRLEFINRVGIRLSITFLIYLLIISLTLCLLALLEIKWSGINLEEWWRNEQFWLIGGTSAHLAAVLQGLLKVIAGIEISFTLTSKSGGDDNDDDDDEFKNGFELEPGNSSQNQDPDEWKDSDDEDEHSGGRNGIHIPDSVRSQEGNIEIYFIFIFVKHQFAVAKTMKHKKTGEKRNQR